MANTLSIAALVTSHPVYVGHERNERNTNFLLNSGTKLLTEHLTSAQSMFAPQPPTFSHSSALLISPTFAHLIVFKGAVKVIQHGR